MIPFDGFIANEFFGNQFEKRLKEIDIEETISSKATLHCNTDEAHFSSIDSRKHGL
jgi:hypothetical protein